MRLQGRWIGLALALTGCRAARQAPEDPAPEVVFVCEHGAAKSVIAAAYFSEVSRARGMTARGVARGADPQDSPSVKTLDGLRADGLAPAADPPRLLTGDDVRAAVRVVTFDCTDPPMKALKGMGACWNDVPPVGEDYGRARDDIRAHVSALVDELLAAHHDGS